MIAIIVVGYNNKNDLSDCFNSLQKSSVNDYRIIYVDNASSDGSVDFVKDNYPKIIIIKNKNTGYAGGNNAGIRRALKLGSDYIFLLNPDTITDKHCLRQLIGRANQNTILQPLILLNRQGKKTNLINTTGGCLNYLGFSYCSDYKKSKDRVKDREIPIASGAAVLVPKKMIKSIGLLDENFFMYHEDVDWFWRARLHGYDIKLVTNALVWHKYSFSKNKNKFYLTERNRLLFLYKNFSVKYLLLILPIFLLNEIFMISYSLLCGWFILKIKSYTSALTLIGQEAKKRKINLLNACQTEGQLKKYIGINILFLEIQNPILPPYNVILMLYWNLIYCLI